MHWLKKNLWKVGIALASTLLLLVLMAPISALADGLDKGALGSAMPRTVTVEPTPTEDATVTALSKEQLTQQVAQQQHTWDNWLWSNAATILSSFLSTLVIVVGALFGLWRWRSDRRDAQGKELEDRENEREKRAEERFQSAVTGFGDDKEGARIGAAILLRTFLRPGYEQFYMQTFDLAVANLRFPRKPQLPEELTTLHHALITIFTEAFPLVRNELEKHKDKPFNARSLDASNIQLDRAFLWKADLERVFMPWASLRGIILSEANLRMAQLWEADLSNAYLDEAHLNGADLGGSKLMGARLGKANLSGAKLSWTNLSKAYLSEADLEAADLSKADLSGTRLSWTNLSKAYLSEADLSEADLEAADLSEANLSGANLSNVLKLEKVRSLKNTNLHGVIGLTKEQLEACKAKGAIIDA